MTMTHRKSGTRLHVIWKSMRTRCNNPNSSQYKNYGGRGIKICEEWNDFQVFYEWAMENGYKENLTIDRIDNNKGYSPDNCRWANTFVQSNNKQNSLRFAYKGKEYAPSELSKLLGISVYTLYSSHSRSGRRDFTDFIPQHANEKNITKRPYSYELNVKGKYCGSFKTLEEAIAERERLTKKVR